MPKKRPTKEEALDLYRAVYGSIKDAAFDDGAADEVVREMRHVVEAETALAAGQHLAGLGYGASDESRGLAWDAWEIRRRWAKVCGQPFKECVPRLCPHCGENLDA